MLALRHPKAQQPRFQASPIRHSPTSPSRSSLQQSNISNYARLERVNEPFKNPKGPGTPRQSQPSTLRNVDTVSSTLDNKDIYIADSGAKDRDPKSPSASQ
jgi:hypothetical protein